jgi:hypothetical protein
MTLPSLRQILVFLVLAFIAYAVLTVPGQAGDVTRDAWAHIKDGFEAVTTFFDTLIGS